MIKVGVKFLTALKFLPAFFHPSRGIKKRAEIIVGLVFVIGTLGEPTTFHPEIPLEEFFHLIWLMLALVLIAAAGWTRTSAWGAL